MKKNNHKIEEITALPGLSAINDIKYLGVDLIALKNEAPEKEQYKCSGHFIDQVLKYDYPKDNKTLLVFENLQENTKRNIINANVEKTEIVEGIKLSPSEQKVIDSLCKLFHEKSQTSEPEKDDFYTGNLGYEMMAYGGDKNTKAPKLGFTLYELTLEYKGGGALSGKDVENVKDILHELDKRRFLLSYVETTRNKDGSRTERKIEDFQKLIHILKISETTISKKELELSKKEDTIILLNPIFRRQIGSKFILYPKDINRRTIIAYGTHNISEITLRLRDYLMREASSKRYVTEIYVDRLYYLLAEKWMKESRKKKVKEYTMIALQTVITLGLLSNYAIVEGASGEPKIIFNINENWE